MAVPYLYKKSSATKHKRISPLQAVCLSFVLVIGLGAAALMLPFATYDGITLVDALFTATSATCVTGLVVMDTCTSFTFFGQVVILLMIQVGGLGLVTLTSFFALTMRRRICAECTPECTSRPCLSQVDALHRVAITELQPFPSRTNL